MPKDNNLSWINNVEFKTFFSRVFVLLLEKKGVLLIFKCMFCCCPQYQFISSIADVFLMNPTSVISSLPSSAVGNHFPPGPAPYLVLLWMSWDQGWNQHPYWSAGKVDKGGTGWGSKVSQRARLFLHPPLSTEVGDRLLTFLHFSIETVAHTGLLLAAGVVIRKLKSLSARRLSASHRTFQPPPRCWLTGL